MKKSMFLTSGAVVLALAFGSTAAVFARSSAVHAPAAAVPSVPAAVPMAANSGALLETSYKYGAAGDVRIYRASREPNRFVIFISGDGGWNQGVVDMARQLARMDATVVGVNIRAYLKTAQAGSAATLYPAGDFSSLAQAVQKSLGFARYHRPVVVGYSSGATLAYGTLAQSPSGIFQGGVGLGFCPDLKTAKPLAAGDGRLTHTTHPTLGFVYDPVKLTAPFVALQGLQDKTCLPDATHAFIARTPRASVLDLPKVGHGYSVPANWAPQFSQAFASLYPRTVAMGAAPSALAATRLAELPLVEVPAVGKGDTLAVFYSGDGGWAGVDRGLADGLVKAGVPVVGYDSLRYFWTGRTSQEAASDLTAVLRRYMAVWGKSKIVLAGYSFGADALPAIVEHLPPDLRASIRLVALIGVDKEGELEFQPGDWLDQSAASAYQIAPTLAELKGVPMACVYGDQESDAACPTFPAGEIRQLRLSGGHHLNGDYAGVGEKLVQAAGIQA